MTNREIYIILISFSFCEYFVFRNLFTIDLVIIFLPENVSVIRDSPLSLVVRRRRRHPVVGAGSVTNGWSGGGRSAAAITPRHYRIPDGSMATRPGCAGPAPPLCAGPVFTTGPSSAVCRSYLHHWPFLRCVPVLSSPLALLLRCVPVLSSPLALLLRCVPVLSSPLALLLRCVPVLSSPLALLLRCVPVLSSPLALPPLCAGPVFTTGPSSAVRRSYLHHWPFLRCVPVLSSPLVLPPLCAGPIFTAGPAPPLCAGPVFTPGPSSAGSPLAV